MVLEIGEINKYNKAQAYPSVDITFIGNKRSLVDRVSGNAAQFTRNTIGTYVGADGLIKTAAAGELRYTYDPLTGEELGLLVEENRTNFITRSEELDDTGSTGWIPHSSSVFPNAILSPDGNTTADKLVESNLTSEHYIRTSSTASVVSGNKYTISIFAKPAERSILRIAATTSTLPGSVTFDLINQTFSENGAIGHPVQVLPNGWYRCSATFTASASSTTFSYFYLSGFYAGDGTSGMYLWGAQFETGSFPTSYIPTSGSTETRAADEASITGTNFSSWYNQSEGTVFANAICNGLSISNVSFVGHLSDGTTNNYIDVFRYQPTGFSLVVVGGAVQSGLISSVTRGSYHKSALAYKTNDFSLSVDGASVTTDNSGSLPSQSISILTLGNDSSNVRALNGHISRLTYYPKRLPDIELQQLTK